MIGWSGQENPRNTVIFWARYQARKTWISVQPTNRARKTQERIHHGLIPSQENSCIWIPGQKNPRIYRAGCQARKTWTSMRYEGQKNPNAILLLDRYRARKTRVSGSPWIKISGQKNLNIYLWCRAKKTRASRTVRARKIRSPTFCLTEGQENPKSPMEIPGQKNPRI